MEKPPVINKFTFTLHGSPVTLGEDTIYGTPLMSIGMTAQRDADVEWYSEKLTIPHSGLEVELYKKIQQVRQETAREIFEEIERAYYLIDREQPRASGLVALPVSWQALKAKYIK